MEELQQNMPKDDWQQRLCAMLHDLQQSKDAVNHLMRTSNVAPVYGLLRDELVAILLGVIDDLCEGSNVSQEDRNLIAEFYVGGLLEVVLAWIRDGMHEPPETLVRHLGTVLQSDVFTRLAQHSL